MQKLVPVIYKKIINERRGTQQCNSLHHAVIFFAQQDVLKAISASSLYCAFSGFEKYEIDNSEKVFLLPTVKIDPQYFVHVISSFS